MGCWDCQASQLGLANLNERWVCEALPRLLARPILRPSRDHTGASGLALTFDGGSLSMSLPGTSRHRVQKNAPKEAWEYLKTPMDHSRGPRTDLEAPRSSRISAGVEGTGCHEHLGYWLPTPALGK